MSRYFTRDEAQSLIPKLERTIREAVDLKQEFRSVEAEIRELTNRIMMLGGSQVNQNQFIDLRARREVAIRNLKDAVDRVHGFGCLVKDLDMGLVDFPTLFEGREVYLCWRLGESEIAFWHGIDEGFPGRKPIDDEFLAGHRGGSGSA